MRGILLGLLAAGALAGCADTGYGTSNYDGYRSYDYNRPDPSYGGYYADRYYRDDRSYRERRLARDERVYRGQDGRVVGVVGVIGPTRLNYARVVPMVDLTAKALTRLMG